MSKPEQETRFYSLAISVAVIAFIVFMLFTRR
jgi:hypothetical protein